MEHLNDFEIKANTLYLSHNYLANVNRIVHEFISISTIIISAFMTTFLPFISNSILVNSILGFYITLVTTISKSIKPAERYQRHRIASQNYISLKSKIKYFSLQPDNLSALDILHKFEKIRKESPFIPNSVYDKFTHTSLSSGHMSPLTPHTQQV